MGVSAEIPWPRRTCTLAGFFTGVAPSKIESTRQTDEGQQYWSNNYRVTTTSPIWCGYNLENVRMLNGIKFTLISVKLAVILSAGALMASCSSAPPKPPSEPEGDSESLTPGWTIAEEVARFDFSHRVRGHGPLREAGLPPPPPRFEVAYLSKQPEGYWVAKLNGNAGQPGVEAIVLDLRTKSVGLAATAPENFENRVGNICEMNADGDRGKSGYLLCNSAFAKTYLNPGVLLFSPLNMLGGYDIQTLELDKNKFKSAVADIDLDQVVTAIESRNAMANMLERAAAQQERERREAELAAFQRTLRPGMQSHCGLVVEIKRPIALVQAKGAGAVWLRLESLRPPGRGISLRQFARECQ